MGRLWTCRAKVVIFVLSPGIILPIAPQSSAYERYNDGCHFCHGSFLDGVSPRGTVFPADSKHAMHANIMATHCNLCHHIEDDWNPFIGLSDGTAHNPPAGCAGCHGRDYGQGIGDSGAGLRAHHAFAGVSACASCHRDDPIPLPENVAPSYYGTPDTDVDDPCNTAPGYRENWTVGDTIGLDNDGDGLFDGDDNDCCLTDVDGSQPFDLEGFAVFASCMRGPGEPPGPACCLSDLDGDADADMADFSRIQRTLIERN